MWFSDEGAPELQVVARHPTGSLPKSVTVSPDGSRLVVCNFGRPNGDNVTIHDAADLSIVRVVRGLDGNAVESEYSPDGRHLYISNFKRGVVHVLDGESYEVLREIPVGSNPKTIVADPGGRIIYVANWSMRNVSVVDVAAGVELRRLRTGMNPRGMVIAPDGALYVASMFDDFVQVFPPGATEESGHFETCQFPRHLVMGPDPNTIYVTCTLGSIGVYDRRNGERIGYAATNRNPRTLDISPDGRFLATANFHSSDVSLADMERHTHHSSAVPGANQMVGLAMHNGSGLRVYATSWLSSEVFALEPRTRGGSTTRQEH